MNASTYHQFYSLYGTHVFNDADKILYFASHAVALTMHYIICCTQNAVYIFASFFFMFSWFPVQLGSLEPTCKFTFRTTVRSLCTLRALPFRPPKRCSYECSTSSHFLHACLLFTGFVHYCHMVWCVVLQQGFFQDNGQEGAMAKYSDVMGGRCVRMWNHRGVYKGVLGVCSPREILFFLDLIRWYLRLF